MKIKMVSGICLLAALLLSGWTCAGSAAQAPILIGATVSRQGKYPEPSAMMQKAFRVWVDEINRGGGLLGRKIKLIVYDDQGRVDLVRRLYRKLIEEDRVDLVFSPFSTPLTEAAAQITEQHHMILLACGAAGEAPWQHGTRYLFGVHAPAKRMFIGILDIMARQGYKTVSLLYDKTSSFNQDIIRGIQNWTPKFKIRIAMAKAYLDGQNELPGLVQEAKQINAGGLILAAYSPDCYTLLNHLGRQQYKPGVLAMTVGPVHPDFAKRAGKMADHVFAPSQWEPDSRIPFPGTQHFIQAFEAANGHMPSYHAATAYAACQLYERAVKGTHGLDNEKMRDFIATLDTVTIIGRFKVETRGKQVGHNSFIIQWQNGKKEIVWPRKLRTANPLF